MKTMKLNDEDQATSPNISLLISGLRSGTRRSTENPMQHADMDAPSYIHVGGVARTSLDLSYLQDAGPCPSQSSTSHRQPRLLKYWTYMEPYGHFPTPLERPNSQIRLLKLESSTPIHGLAVSLTTYDFETAPDYLAISYTWGGDAEVQDMQIDGRTCAVRPKCHLALSQAKRHYPREMFWIDM